MFKEVQGIQFYTEEDEDKARTTVMEFLGVSIVAVLMVGLAFTALAIRTQGYTLPGPVVQQL